MVMRAYKPEPDVSKLHPDSVIREVTVLKIIPVSRGTWRNGVRDGLYPKPIKISARGVGWRLREIIDLVNRLQKEQTGRAG